MATLLEITNKVLKRLREETVSAGELVTDAYANLVAQWVAEVAKDVNEATMWTVLDHEVTVSVTPGTTDYALTGTTNESQLLFDARGMPLAFIYDDSNDTDGEQMYYLDPYEYTRRVNQDRSLENDKPQWFTIEAATDNDSMQIKLWPKPSATKYIRIKFNTPEPELDPDTDADTEIKMPERVVRLGALLIALNERGEEIGEPGNMAEQRYNNALARAVENELRLRERSGQYDWERN